MKRSIVAALLLAHIATPLVSAEEMTTQLKEVVVTATKTEKLPEDVTQSVTIITAEEIQQTNASDIAAVIQNATSVHISGYGTPGSVQSLKIRGAYSSQILVLLDGVRMNSSRDGGFDLSLIPVAVDDVERIEIVRGPGSALYGSDAVGGVINIITKKPSENVNKFAGEIGSNGYDNLFANNSGRHGAWYYSVTAERETSDGYRTNSDLYQWVYGGRIGYDFSKKSSLEVTANYLSNEVGSPGPGSLVYGEPPVARQLERNSVLGASYSAEIASTVNTKIRGYRKLDDLTYRDPGYIDFFLGPSPINNRYETRSDGGEVQVSFLLASWNQFVAGYELRRDYLTSRDANSLSKRSASLNAYYIQDEISIGEQFIVVLGGRHDDHSVYGTRFSPKASTRYSIPGTGTIIRASYGKSFRAPTFNDLFFTSSWAVGNPNLRPESAKEYEAGIEQKIGKRSTVAVSGFNRKVRDMIEWNWWDYFPMQVENRGKIHIHGVESEVSYDAGDTVRVALNYTYINPVDELKGERVYYTIPKSQVKGRITVYPHKSLYLTVEGRVVENYTRPGEAPWQYSVADAKIAAKTGQFGEIFLGMNNAFDRKYEAVQGYPMPPREIRGGMTLQF